MLHARVRDLAVRLGVLDQNSKKLDYEILPLLNKRVLPHSRASVLLNRMSHRSLCPMVFTLLPHWSETRTLKFATHNARLETFDKNHQVPVWIYEKPTWREAFMRRHCVIPMTHFIEPIYTGKWAGNMVRFSSQTSNEILCAAGIWEEWVGLDGEVIESFAIITDEASQFVKKSGHDRSPLFLTEAGIQDWLDPKPHLNPAELVRVLRENSFHPNLRIDLERPLKSGWQKKV